MQCSICGKQVSKYRLLPGGNAVCWNCDLRWNEGYLRFAEYWKKYKTSEHGMELIDRIIKETADNIDKAKREIRIGLR